MFFQACNQKPIAKHLLTREQEVPKFLYNNFYVLGLNTAVLYYCNHGNEVPLTITLSFHFNKDFV